jgi:hypothetical protein
MAELCIRFLDMCQHWSTSAEYVYGAAEGSKPQARHLEYHNLWLDNNLPQYPEHQ